jgi:hypothetical protein
MPPFAWAKRNVMVNAIDGAFVPGKTYEVKFEAKKQYVVADSTSQLVVAVPPGLKPGPIQVEVKGQGYEHRHSEADFTALPKPFRVNSRNAALYAHHAKVAVTADGTVLVPVDLSRVRDPMQFALEFGTLPLAFGEDDVVLYNADGVDLSVFTLAVDDATERQWGSYYGWEVETDAGLKGTVYGHKVRKAKSKELSDVFTYWRHEFHSYAAAHGNNGSHRVDARGFHPDGTLHVDHDHLVIAISGLEFPLDEREKIVEANLALEQELADAAGELDVAKVREKYAKKLEKANEKAQRLKGGEKSVDLWLLTILADHPMEPDDVLGSPLYIEDAQLAD